MTPAPADAQPVRVPCPNKVDGVCPLPNVHCAYPKCTEGTVPRSHVTPAAPAQDAPADAQPVAWLSTVITPVGSKLQRLGFTRDEAEMANATPQPLYARPPAAPAQDVGERDPRVPDCDLVICPNCVHEFRAIPVNVQAELTRLRAALDAARADTKSAGQATDDYRERYNKEHAANDNLRKDLDAAKRERADTVATLRIECAELGANDWPDDLHLTDVIEKHLCRAANARAEANAKDAGYWRFVRTERRVMLLTSFFGNGCVNRTIEEVEAVIDAAKGTTP